jgi:crotonobetainyl-CoA:carnitine CoA-transferase CaiB-like acyl-CoA transferase
MQGPLKGINILDMGTGGVGPWAPSLLGMMGANVIKLESPSGDALRIVPPYVAGVPIAYTFCNINKRGLTIDLKQKDNWVVMERLLKEADVLVQNLRPGAMDRLGLSYEAVKQINPSIVYVECSAWGFEGDMKNLVGAAGLADAFGGFTSLNGDPGSRPERLRYPYTDFNAASYVAAATLLALYARERTGQSQSARLTQAGGTIAIAISRIAEYFVTGESPLPLGNASASTAPHQAFLCQDKRYLAVGVETEEQWKSLCIALGLGDLIEDSRFATNIDRVSHRDELGDILQKVFLTKAARWWSIRLGQGRVPYGYFYDFETLRNHIQVLENDFLPLLDIPPGGELYTGCLPWNFSKTPAKLSAAPSPGQHTQEIIEGGFGSSGTKPTAAQSTEAPLSPPLTGLKVVDASQGLCGPYTSLLMALSGAEVIKVEPPGGDYSRGFAPRGPSGDGAAFTQLNHNKKSVVLDIETEEGRNSLQELLQDADVFIEDWGTGKAESLGLGYAHLERSNQRLIFCAITPFGEKGPLKDMPGSELVVQAVSSVSRSLGSMDAPPVRIGADIANLNTALMAYQAIIAALLHRERADQGQRIAVSQLGTLLSIWGALWMAYANPDDWVGFYCDNDISPRSYGLRTRSKEVHFGAPAPTREGGDEDILALFMELGVKEVTEDPLITGPNADPAIRHKLLANARMNPSLWEKYFLTMSSEEVIRKTSRGGTITVPINSLADVLSHPQTQTLDMVDNLTQSEAGTDKFLGLPWKGSWPKVELKAPPVLNQHRHKSTTRS